VKTELQRIAEREGLSVSGAGGAFLEKALQQHVDMQYSALLQPIIREAIVKQMRSISTRLAFLLVRVAFASEQTRSLATNILGRQPGMSPDVLNEFLTAAVKQQKVKPHKAHHSLTTLLPKSNSGYLPKTMRKRPMSNGHCQSHVYQKQDRCEGIHSVY
jgi:hypothetical protein